MLSAVGPPVTVRVPAKINLHLAVGDLRPDGYHDLVTVFQALNLFDEISVVSTHTGRGPVDRIGPGAPGIELLGDVTDAQRADVPLDASNLAWKAAVALAEVAGREPDVRIGLRKSIPVAGGMAGGSADAAGTLLALAALWRLDLGREALMEVAAGVGSDVAFALHGGTALGTGRGENLVPVLSRHTFHWVVALQDHGLSTPAVFGELDRLRATSAADTPVKRVGSVEPVLEAVASGEARSLALLLGNDLQAAAVSMDPGLRRTLRAGVTAGALAGVVSGSGPTCVFLCADGPSAVRVAAELSGAGVCRTVRVAHGPVPGAKVIDGDPARPPRGPGGPPAPDPGPNMYA
ncbi:4-(cytidine 5'-diphospho)-2-C-methyl-D-erythritol kinase [Actinomycetospora termitidis]|uniref:4-diphosphocytidyl-2-C-methyl-D-erythritol kinase n=1 Tax=Actinomycetospora termitidis TaxID=3053470 RepID=A0ABT7M718_9PSEU|nr:4-(cytidine 5'-diphospho)-2-C-methyl-D-erythritol kinase [Actinomycetospora sp. Odt1-22]MDL5155597.1 4-(cytidine 5'-diphospho)-2-C-methyl-D-erythritol kinase [Actinomycetospora sp. Odt1-22]